MNFISKKVLDYQKKKLSDAENNLRYHMSKKEQLTQMSNVDSNDIQNQEKMIKIWIKNIEKIKKEIKKIEQKG